MLLRPPRSTPLYSSAASDVYKRQELLLHFGTIQKIKSASLKELKQVKTIPSKKLEELYEFFNG